MPSFAAHAVATSAFGAALPGVVAQPPFSMKDWRSQEVEIFLSSANVIAASARASNLATHTGVSASTTAASARSLAMRSAELPSVHPSAQNPTIVMMTAPATAPQTAGFTSGRDFIFSP